MWDIKYRPKSVKDYIFGSESQKNRILHYIGNKSIPHLLLQGKPGCGKTSLAYLLKELFEIDDVDFMYHDASKDNGVDAIRNTVTSFISTMPMGDFKLVLMNEADGLSSGAWNVLRGILEDPELVANCRFIFTCNRVHKIPPEILSRLEEFQFQTLNKEEVLIRSAKILKKENIKFDLDVLESIVDKCKMDFRRILKTLQYSSLSGELKINDIDNEEFFEIFANSMLYIAEKNWEKARTLLSENLADDDYDDVFRFYYNNLSEIDTFASDKVKMSKAIIILADYMYRHETVADKEINMAACLIKLSEI